MSWFDSLSSAEQAEIVALLKRTRWVPQAGPQTEAYLTKADRIFYGGAAGAGKTDLLLGTAYNQHTRSIIFRREFTQLQALIDRSHELFDNVGDFNGQKYTWTFPDLNKTIEFGAVQHEGSELKYQGRPHDMKGFDEVTHFTERQFKFLTAWTRTTVKGQRTRVLCAGNPPTNMEGAWVIRYWAPWIIADHPHKAAAGELLRMVTFEGKDYIIDGPVGENGVVEMTSQDGTLVKVMTLTRTFIPGRLSDNRYLNSQYRAELESLPEPLRSQLLFGLMGMPDEDDAWRLLQVQQVQRRMVNGTAETSDPILQVGVDCVYGGDDQMVIAMRTHDRVLPLVMFPGRMVRDGIQGALLVEETLRKHDCLQASIVVDVGGIGVSCYDHLKTNPATPNVYAFNGAESSIAYDKTKRLKMRNKRAEAYWTVREWLLNDEEPLYLPQHEGLLADLTSVRWEPTAQGILLEKKEDVKDRLGRSPDFGDAVAMACVPLSATSWRGLLAFAKEELKAAQEKQQAQKEAEQQGAPKERQHDPLIRSIME